MYLQMGSVFKTVWRIVEGTVEYCLPNFAIQDVTSSGLFGCAAFNLDEECPSFLSCWVWPEGELAHLAAFPHQQWFFRIIVFLVT